MIPFLASKGGNSQEIRTDVGDTGSAEIFRGGEEGARKVDTTGYPNILLA